MLSTTLPTADGVDIMQALRKEQKDFLFSLTGGRYVVPVGRLDKDSTGLLLLTTEEALTAKLLRPSESSQGSLLQKEYLVQTSKRVQTSFLEELRAGGVELSLRNWGREKKKILTLPCLVERSGKSGDNELRFVLREGKNRQIRKMLGARGHHVRSLHRSAFGPITLEGMQEGDLHLLSDAHLTLLLEIVSQKQ